MLEKVISPVRISYVTNGYSYVTQDTVLSPLVYLFCILIRLGSRSNNAVAKLSRQRSGILKRNEESTSSVFHFIWLCFYWKMSHNIYQMSSWATIPEYQPLNDTKALARYVTLCLQQRARAFVSRPDMLCHLMPKAYYLQSHKSHDLIG